MRAEGTVLTADICNTDITFVDKAENPDAWHNFLELYGLRTRSLDPLRPLVLLAYAGELDWSITPHATYSLGRDAFAMAVGGLGGDDGDVLSIHFMESEAERELFQRRGNLWTWYREQDFPVDFLDYGSPAERILAQVPADRNLMLIHNTFVTAGEIEALQAHFGDRLTWVLCPRSNRYITGAQPPAELLRRHGARIALGTDSLASNTDLSLIEEMKMFPDVPLDELLGWVTTNGARALGRDDRLGAFEVGKSPGVVLLEGIDWDRMALLPAASARRLA